MAAFKGPRLAKLGGYRSGFENKVAKVLRKHGIQFKYEPDVLRYDQPIQSALCEKCYSKHVVKRRAYTPDFRIGLGYIEVKGLLTSQERTKFKAIKAHHPSLDIRFVFMKDNLIRKGSSVHYTDWAKALDYPACVGPDLPPEWVKEYKQCNKSTSTASKSDVTVTVETSIPTPSLPPPSIKPLTEADDGTRKTTSTRSIRKSKASPCLKRLGRKSLSKKVK